MKQTNCRWAWIPVILVFLSVTCFAQTTVDSQELTSGKPIERELGGGGVHLYSIKVEAGQFLKAVVDQRGIDVVVTLIAPDGKQLIEVDSPNGRQGPEPVSYVAKTSGAHQIKVHSSEKAAAAGRYQIKIEPLRAATVQEKLESEAKELAQALASAKTDEQRATLLAQRKEWATPELVRALNDQGKQLYGRSDFPQALAILERSQAIAEQLKDKVGLAGALMQLAAVYVRQGNYPRALEVDLRVLSMKEELGDQTGIAQALTNVGNDHRLLGNYGPALESFQKVVVLAEAAGNNTARTYALFNIGIVYQRQNDLGRALDYLQKSLPLAESGNDKRLISNVLMNIGIVYVLQADYSRALEYFEKSLTLKEALGDKGEIARMLSNIGVAHSDQGDYVKALEYLQKGLALREAIGDKAGTAHALNNIGTAYRRQNDYGKALQYYLKSLPLREETGNKEAIADSLQNIATTLALQGDHPKALEFSGRALEIARQLGLRRTLWEAHTTAGSAYAALGQNEPARQAYEEAIRVVDSIRLGIAGPDSRAKYFAEVGGPYELYVDFLMRLHKENPSGGYAAKALGISERSRARSLLEALSEAGVDIREGVDRKLLDRERELGQQLNAAAERQTRLGNGNEDHAAVATKEINELTAKLQDAQAQVRQQSPRYAGLTQPLSLTLSEIQNNVLDAETALLQYALGAERSYLWVVTSSSIKSFELPKRTELDASVRRLVELFGDGKRWVTRDRVAVEYAETAGQLSRQLLPPALMSELKAKRLVIVADGALQYLPFGALPNPQSDERSLKPKHRDQPIASAPPLIADFEIVGLPSVSTLAALRRETANRPRVANSVAVLADPVFEENDERIKTPVGQTRSSESLQSSSRSIDKKYDHVAGSRVLLDRAFRIDSPAATDGSLRETLRIGRLPFTRFEAEGILGAAPPNQSFKAIDFQANRETATSPELAKYRYVHFATHGILNSEHPELSGIVLSLVNEQGQPVDGFLRLHEIYNLNLPADLVVLSACQTGLGKEIRGEGLIGLTRGFMYAGAPRVVASLWKVDDVATAELMKRFYRGMLKENLRPAAALRQAKVEMWKQKRWNAPFYWAAFELQGEWK
jgi:CHAT domain-containing protein/uncharacterized protein HemY